MITFKFRIDINMELNIGSTVSGPSYSQYNQSSVDDLEMETRSINNEGLDDLFVKISLLFTNS